MTRIEDRQGNISFLQFWFFRNGNLSPLKIKLPFIENIDVRESQKSNYVTYQPIGRAGSLFTYTGSESRKLKLSFNFTFDNIAAFTPTTLQNYSGNLDVDDEDQFFPSKKVSIISDAYTAFSKIDFEQSDIQDDKTVQLVMYWVNLIRSSTLNNVEDPTLPPPLIRLSHGTLYRNVPCVCHNYSISYEENAGYDRASFLPRRIRVTMDLSEVRLNQISSIAETSILNATTGSDSLKGWESVIKGESLDPTLSVVTTLKGVTTKEGASINAADTPDFTGIGGINF